MSDLKKKAEEIHHAVVEAGQVYTLRYGEHEDMAVVPLDELVELARERAELLDLVAALERQLAAQAGAPVLGGADEDEIVRQRRSEKRIPGPDVVDAAKKMLGLD